MIDGYAVHLALDVTKPSNFSLASLPDTNVSDTRAQREVRRRLKLTRKRRVVPKGQPVETVPPAFKQFPAKCVFSFRVPRSISTLLFFPTFPIFSPINGVFLTLILEPPPSPSHSLFSHPFPAGKRNPQAGLLAWISLSIGHVEGSVNDAGGDLLVE